MEALSCERADVDLQFVSRAREEHSEPISGNKACLKSVLWGHACCMISCYFRQQQKKLEAISCFRNGSEKEQPIKTQYDVPLFFF